MTDVLPVLHSSIVRQHSEELCVLGQVLSLWTKRALLPSAVLLPEAERLQERLQAHSKAAAARETEKAAAQSSRAADLTNGSKILR